MNEDRRMIDGVTVKKFSCSGRILTPAESSFFLKKEVLHQSGKEEVDLNLLPSHAF
jgi:hypothetical protein